MNSPKFVRISLVAIVCILCMSWQGNGLSAQEVVYEKINADPESYTLEAHTSTRPLGALEQAPVVTPSQGLGIDITEHSLFFRVPKIDAVPLILKDKAGALEAGPAPLRTGLVKDLGVGVNKRADGWLHIPQAGDLWSAVIYAPGAKALRARFTDIYYPEGTQLFVYGANEKDGVQCFEQIPGDEDDDFWSTIFTGEHIFIEYFVPEGVSKDGTFTLSQYAYLYRDPDAPPNTFLEGPCHNDVLCYPTWHPLHNATARIHYVDLFATHLCSATLINTEASDETPYLLTANHCIDNEDDANDLVIRWFFQTQSCNGANQAATVANYTSLLMTDAVLDISLLMVKGTIPDGLTWAGWTLDTLDNGTPVTGIHHPDGARKKISFGEKKPHAFGDAYNYFGVLWNDATIEGGSSGSGLYRSSDGAYVGVMSHSAVPTNCTNPDGPSGYGKFRRMYLDYAAFADYLVAGTDDALEPNDNCLIAMPIGAGTYNDLVVKSVADDWYKITLNDYDEVTVTATHANWHGDVDLRFFNDCYSSYVAGDIGSGNTKVFSYTNNEFGAAHDFYLRVFLGSDTRNEYDLQIDITPGTPTRLTADAATLSVATGGTVNMTLTSGSDHGGRTYLVLGTLSGNSPGIPLPGGLVEVPIVWDSTTDFILARLNTPMFTNFLGVLNGAGDASAQINLGPVSTSKIGKTMHYAYILEGDPWDFASNPVGIAFVP